jgi:hypothetical protein
MISTPVLGWVVAELAAVAMLALLGSLVRTLAPTSMAVDTTARSHRWALLALAGVLPAGVYYHAVFPMSLAAALALTSVAFTHRRVWWAAGVFAGLSAMAYPTAILVAVVAPIAIIYLAWRREIRPRAAVGGIAVASLPALVGLAAVFAIIGTATGHWNGYLVEVSQAFPPGASHNPVRNLLHLLRHAPAYGAQRPSLLPLFDRVMPLEMWATLLLVGLVVLAAVLAARAGQLIAIDVGLVVFALAMFVVPLGLGIYVTQARGHTLLIPALLVLRHLPAKILWVATVLAAPLAFLVGVVFFTSLII